MFTLHILADFHLQGLFCNLKQKKWWDDQLTSYSEEQKKLYSKDYIVGLVLHSFEWAVIFMIPVVLICSNVMYILIALLVNTSIHAFVDDLKCNKEKINLIQDQSIHAIQIVLTWLVFFTILY